MLRWLKRLEAAVYVGEKTLPAQAAKEKASLDGGGSTGVISIFMCCQGLKPYTSRKLCKTFIVLQKSIDDRSGIFIIVQ
jgi:hypothetical protein